MWYRNLFLSILGMYKTIFVYTSYGKLVYIPYRQIIYTSHGQKVLVYIKYRKFIYIWYETKMSILDIETYFCVYIAYRKFVFIL